MRELPSLSPKPVVGPKSAGADLASLVRERTSDIALRWRKSLAAAAMSGDRDLIDVVFLVALAAERPDDLDEIRRRAAEALMARSSDLPQTLRDLGLLRGLLSDLVTEQNMDPSLRRRMDEAIDSLAEAAAAVTTERLNEVAFADPLTRLPNRRALDRDLTREIARATRGRLGLTVVVGDLDGLKQINDSLGHAAGDRTLQALADALRKAVRDEDCAYRIGGDEFVVLLPGASCADAGLVMARAKAAGAPEFSWGAATFPGDGTDGATVLEVADRRLLDSRARPQRANPSPPQAPVDRRRLRRGRHVAGLASVMLGGALLGAGGVAAADGTLPPPVQHVVHVALDRISIGVPPASEGQRQSPNQHPGHGDGQGSATRNSAAGTSARVSLPGPAKVGTSGCTPPGAPAGEEVASNRPATARCGGPNGTAPASAGAQEEKPEQRGGSREAGSLQGNDDAGRATGDATPAPAGDGVKSGGRDRQVTRNEDRKPAGSGADGARDAGKTGGAKSGAASRR